MTAMNVLLLVFMCFWILDHRFCCAQNVTLLFVEDRIFNYTISRPGRYEISAAGACGGGIYGGDGGRGGISAGVEDLEVNFKLSVVVGGPGKSPTSTCGTAGGGGATIVYIYKGVNTIQSGQLFLVGPGGGGGGLGQKPDDPDYNGFNNARSNPSCVLFKEKDYQAAPGRNYDKDLKLFSKFSSNTNDYPNTTGTPGCLGGYGGGGQGGFMVNLQNYSDAGGGGGGGGGYTGGQTTTLNGYGVCTAGGPGKPFCAMRWCDVPKRNKACAALFTMRLHEPYRELKEPPLKSRSNTEVPYRPGVIQRNGQTLKFFISVLIVNLINARICVALGG